jgi:hypothetical protein
LALMAVTGQRAQWGIKPAGQCQVQARVTYEHVFGEIFADIDLGTAKLSGLNFALHGYSIHLGRGSLPGDLLYKVHGSGGFGHVGIRVAGNMVAENSSIHWDGNDARGLRTLEEFGHFDLIIRLHDKPPKKG